MNQEPNKPGSKFEQQAEGALNAAFKVFGRAKARAGEIAHENRSKIDEALDKAGRVVDEKTGGKYHDKVEKVKAQAARGVDLVEQERHTDPDAAGDGPAAAATNPGGAAAAPTAGPSMASPIPTYTPPATAPAGPPPAAGAPVTPPAPGGSAPAAPMPPAPTPGWHRGPDGNWVRDTPQP